jgi:hypothetical protein
MAPPQRTLGGDAGRVRGHLQGSDAELLKVVLPGGLVGKLPLGVRCQLPDHRSGQVVFPPVLQRRVMDDAVGMAATQQLQEVQPALASSGAEPGKVVVADLRADGVGAAVARAGVVHRDPAGGLQPRLQHLLVLGQKVVLLVDQPPHHLAFGNADPERLQLSQQPLHRDLALDVLHHHVAAQRRPEMAADASRQRCHNARAVRCQPALTAVAHHPPRITRSCT